MKTNLLTIALLSVSMAGLAQSRSSNVVSNINDDDKTLSIQVAGTVDGREVNYNRQFRVTGMSKAQKDALKERVMDSLGLGPVPTPPKPPMPPTNSEAAPNPPAEETLTVVCETCTGKMRLEITGEGFSMSREMRPKQGQESAFPMKLTLRPGTYQYKYWQNGVLQMDLPFDVKAGQKNVLTVK